MMKVVHGTNSSYLSDLITSSRHERRLCIAEVYALDQTGKGRENKVSECHALTCVASITLNGSSEHKCSALTPTRYCKSAKDICTRYFSHHPINTALIRTQNSGHGCAFRIGGCQNHYMSLKSGISLCLAWRCNEDS